MREERGRKRSNNRKMRKIGRKMRKGRGKRMNKN